MATGRMRCMYCEDSAGSDLEHFWPRAAYPERAFTWENLLFACSHCNSNVKRHQFPLDASGQPLLLDPTQDEPLDHLLFAETGHYKHRSRKGKTSIQVFDLNRTTLAEGRRDAWIAIPELLIRYAQHRAAGRREQAKDVEQALRRYPFSGVFAAFLRIAKSRSSRRHLITPECLAVLRDHPEIATWL
ncbi:MAG TPA: HNH endonuclease [Thermoanaerobaculia bacterium]|nr:HNH endonuclease [Thermoanaerobaculia bacterium]